MTDAVPPELVRVTDADRRRVEERLRQAHAAGSLDLAEFDQRIVQLWRTKTRQDLAVLTGDLPAPDPPAAPAPPPAPKSEVSAMRVLTTIWLCVSVVNIVIWLIVGVSGATPISSLHPWWIWVLVPPGSVLGVLWAMGIGRRPR